MTVSCLGADDAEAVQVILRIIGENAEKVFRRS